MKKEFNAPEVEILLVGEGEAIWTAFRASGEVNDGKEIPDW